jgi:flagellar biosynthesis protein FlhF
MRLKSFYASSMTEAMQMVRDTLGEEAVIVATREENGGRAVRVTAAVEHMDHAEEINTHQEDHRSVNRSDEKQRFNSRPAERRGPLPAENEKDWYNDGLYSDDEEEAVIEILTDVMLRHSVPEEITDQIISCATIIGLEQPDIALIAAIEHLYSFTAVQDIKQKAIMLVGPPGAGKTLTAAKLAANGVLADKSVAVITTDTIRAGGIEQLQAFTGLMDIKLKKATSPKSLNQAIELSSTSDMVIIDTSGLNPFDREQMQTLAKYIAAGTHHMPIEPVLVLPSGIDADESAEMARVYGGLGVRNLMASRIDIARRLGGLLAAAHSGGLYFAEASNTPKVADGLFELSPKTLAHILMPEAKKKTTSKKPQITRRQKERIE